MKVARINQDGVHYGTFDEDDPDPERRFTREAMVRLIESGHRLVMLKEGDEPPPIGHRYDPDAATFEPYKPWLAENVDLANANAADLQSTADVAEAIAERLKMLPSEAVHPAELAAADARTLELRVAAWAEIAASAKWAAKRDAATDPKTEPGDASAELEPRLDGALAEVKR